MSVTRIMVVYKNFLKFSDVVPDLCTFMKPTEIFVRVKIVLKNTCNKVGIDCWSRKTGANYAYWLFR